MTSTTSSAIAERCWLIALGVPYLEPPFDETVRAFVSQGSPFDVGWEPQDGGAANACTEAFGNGWRLPTLAEAQAAFELRALSARAATSVLVRDDERGIVTAKFSPRSGPGCGPLDPGCVWHIELETDRARSGLLHCVGPASRLPSLEPSDSEIKQCVHRATSEAARLDRTKVVRLVPEQELDLVFSMRRACKTQKLAEFDAVARRLDDSADGVPLHRRAADVERALANASAGHLIAQKAMSEGEGGDDAAYCAELSAGHEKTCNIQSCLWVQARYAARCLGRDPTERIQRLMGQLAVRMAELSKEAPRLRTRVQVGATVARCAKDPSVSRRFAALLGERPPASAPAPECICPIEDLDCGISLLLDPEKCPSSPQNVRTPGACGCAENDLACAMKCAE